jgi:hypothetical protein
MSDPTGTTKLRRQFRAAANRELQQLQKVVRIVLVEQDFMSHRSDPMWSLFRHVPMDPGAKLASFSEWFQFATEMTLGSEWMLPYLRAAWLSGQVAGDNLLPGPQPPGPMPAVHLELAKREIAGILAVLVQQVTRATHRAVLMKTKPPMMYRQVLAIMRKIQEQRIWKLCNSMIVTMHNAGRLAQFKSFGLTTVGIIPERLPRRPGGFTLGELAARTDSLALRHVHDIEGPGSRSSREETPSASTIGRIEAVTERLTALEEVNVVTAGDDRVCDECEDIADGGPYGIDEAMGLIPAHPDCRCAFVPSEDQRFSRELEAEFE